METQRKINLPKDKVVEFCKRNHIAKLSLFGSILREDFNTESDIDILVEFQAGHEPGYFGLAHMERELSNFLGGKKVDLRTPNELSKYFRKDVLALAEVQYAQG